MANAYLSKNICHSCDNKYHHTLLHITIIKSSSGEINSDTQLSSWNNNTTSFAGAACTNSTVVLDTAIIHIKDVWMFEDEPLPFVYYLTVVVKFWLWQATVYLKFVYKKTLPVQHRWSRTKSHYSVLRSYQVFIFVTFRFRICYSDSRFCDIANYSSNAVHTYAFQRASLISISFTSWKGLPHSSVYRSYFWSGYFSQSCSFTCWHWTLFWFSISFEHPTWMDNLRIIFLIEYTINRQYHPVNQSIHD